MTVFQSEKIVVYTVIISNYDILKEPYIVSDNIDYLCFTDNRKLKSKTWKIIQIETEKFSASLLNRKIKLLGPFNELKSYTKSIYIDGSILIKSDLSSFFSKYADISLGNFRHPRRNCIYDEIASCILSGKGDPIMHIAQCRDYAMNKMPVQFGLSDNKIILRDHRNPLVSKLMHEWWENVTNYSGRDQTCLSYVLYKNNLGYSFFEESIINNPYFEIWPHRNEYKRRIWRNFKQFCERNSIFLKLIKAIDKKIKSGNLKETYI